MATTSNFDAMLRSFAPDALFREELVKRDWFLNNVEKDDTWLGGNLEVRFQGSRASSVKFGSLTSSADIAQSQYVLGQVTSQPEVWGSLIFNEKDLMRHGKLSEQNFLKLLPGEIEDFSDFMKMGLSMSFTNGPKLATLTGDGQIGGTAVIDRIERVELGQKLRLMDNNSAAIDVYVVGISIDTNTITVSATRGGAALDISAYTVAQAAVLYLDGQDVSANQLTSLKASLLSAANGGVATLYGQTKTAYPYLQSVNIAGSTITATNILDQLFAAQTRVRNVGKGNANTIVCSYKHLGSILTRLEALKGAYRMADDMKASLYGWTEVVISGVKGTLKIVAIQEMDDDWMAILDMSALKVYSNGFIKKRVSPDGQLYYVIRNTTGYQYIVDICFFGDMILERPSRCGIIYGISY